MFKRINSNTVKGKNFASLSYINKMCQNSGSSINPEKQLSVPYSAYLRTEVQNVSYAYPGK